MKVKLVKVKYPTLQERVGSSEDFVVWIAEATRLVLLGSYFARTRWRSSPPH